MFNIYIYYHINIAKRYLYEAVADPFEVEKSKQKTKKKLKKNHKKIYIFSICTLQKKEKQQFIFTTFKVQYHDISNIEQQMSDESSANNQTQSIVFTYPANLDRKSVV